MGIRLRLILDGTDGPLTPDQKQDLRRILTNAHRLEARITPLLDAKE